MKLTNFKVNSEKKAVHWTSSKRYSSNEIVQWMQYRKSEPDKIVYRTNYDESKPFDEIIVRRTATKQALPSLVPCYSGKLPISTKKLDDLLKLCEDYAIPERYHYFYSGLVGGREDGIYETGLQSSDDEAEAGDEE